LAQGRLGWSFAFQPIQAGGQVAEHPVAEGSEDGGRARVEVEDVAAEGTESCEGGGVNPTSEKRFAEAGDEIGGLCLGQRQRARSVGSRQVRENELGDGVGDRAVWLGECPGIGGIKVAPGPSETSLKGKLETKFRLYSEARVCDPPGDGGRIPIQPGLQNDRAEAGAFSAVASKECLDQGGKRLIR
jgi:hypothetical protein